MTVLPRLIAVLVATVLVLSLSPASAQETTWVRGVVAAMAGGTLTVKVGGQDMTFTVDNATRVIGEGGSTATREARLQGKEGPMLSDVLKVGESVEVHYSASGSGNYASVVRRIAPGSSPTAPGAAPAKPPVEPGKSVRGQVEAVTGNSLTVAASGRQYVFAVDGATLVLGTGFGSMTREKLRAGEKPILTDFIQKGDLVLVDYRQQGTGLLAVEVHMLKKFLK